ncbi:hypothetical protein AQZ52_08175 [Novosphingobium fuchskuhlense]|uniref:DUF11 domain-containing protein n=1 Tax=Novosphingobium fuchskuhlense TaxID=1117702 RepID=A0A117UVH2_9SPHN|nr:DUF11 domain-containing protein [Novosphingobium fuchskuhlense]KUR71588.1 hypothetical protein AQZ52_08175 [Novosphingobium fuchskuhlense]
MNVSILVKSLAGSIAMMAMASPALAAAQATPAASAQAPAAVSLKIDVMIEKTVTENGVSKVQLVDPKVVVPGDKLVYTLRYHNAGGLPAVNYVMTNPLPSAVLLAPDGAPGTDVSVDGGKTWGKLDALKVTATDGSPRAAAAADVTHIRWTIAQIAPGASGEVQYHGIVR